MIESTRPELVSVSSLSCHPDNPRVGDVSVIVESIKSNGWYGTVIAQRSTGFVLAGNHRLKAAREYGLDSVPVIWLDIDDDRALRILLADNRTSDLASYDDTVLARLLEDLNASSEGLIGTGFDDSFLAELLGGFPVGNEGLTDPDSIPEVGEDPITEMGNLWILGDHRLLCGDSTNPADIDRLMDGRLADTVATDPPYGVNYIGGSGLVVENDDPEGLHELLRGALGNASNVTKEGGVWYVAAPPGPQFADFASVLGELGIWRQTLVWVKDSLVLGRSDYHYRHEAIFYGWKPGKAHQTPPDRKQTTVWEFDRPKASKVHPTMKPVSLYEMMLTNSTNPGDVVLEPFCGSGTTVIAAEKTGRRCFGIELSEKYCDVIVKRWEEFTGQKAKRT